MNITLDGYSTALGIWQLSWDTSLISSKVFGILVSEMLGYNIHYGTGAAEMMSFLGSHEQELIPKADLMASATLWCRKLAFVEFVRQPGHQCCDVLCDPLDRLAWTAIEPSPTVRRREPNPTKTREFWLQDMTTNTWSRALSIFMKKGSGYDTFFAVQPLSYCWSPFNLLPTSIKVFTSFCWDSCVSSIVHSRVSYLGLGDQHAIPRQWAKLCWLFYFQSMLTPLLVASLWTSSFRLPWRIWKRFCGLDAGRLYQYCTQWHPGWVWSTATLAFFFRKLAGRQAGHTNDLAGVGWVPLMQKWSKHSCFLQGELFHLCWCRHVSKDVIAALMVLPFGLGAVKWPLEIGKHGEHGMKQKQKVCDNRCRSEGSCCATFVLP